MKRKDKDAKALWAEVNRLTLEMSLLQQQYDELTAGMIVHRGQELACSEAVCAAYFDERRRAERLEEALREAREKREALLDALRQIAEWPDGGSFYGQEKIKRFAKHAIDAAMREEGEQ